MFADPVLLWYIHVALSLINEFRAVNAFFQKTNANPVSAMQQLGWLYEGLKQRAYDQNKNP